MLPLKRSSTLLALGLLLPLTAGCSSSVKSPSVSKTVSPLPAPQILTDKAPSIPSLDARVTKLVFFSSSPSDISPLRNPIYKNQFAHTTTTTVHPEIHLDHVPPAKRVFFALTVHIRENGKTVRIVDYDSRIDADSTSSYHSVGVGVLGTGNWRVGTYDVDVHINGEKIATGHFQVY